jgi:hypothetical protein
MLVPSNYVVAVHHLLIVIVLLIQIASTFLLTVVLGDISSLLVDRAMVIRTQGLLIST